LNGNPYRHTYFYTQDSGQTDDDGSLKVLPILFAVFLVVILLLRFLCTGGVRTETEEQKAGGGDDTDVRQLQRNE